MLSKPYCTVGVRPVSKREFFELFAERKAVDYADSAIHASCLVSAERDGFIGPIESYRDPEDAVAHAVTRQLRLAKEAGVSDDEAVRQVIAYWGTGIAHALYGALYGDGPC